MVQLSLMLLPSIVLVGATQTFGGVKLSATNLAMALACYNTNLLYNFDPDCNSGKTTMKVTNCFLNEP